MDKEAYSGGNIAEIHLKHVPDEERVCRYTPAPKRAFIYVVANLLLGWSQI